MTADAKARIRDEALDGQSFNARQARALLNHTPEADSALEHLALAFALIDRRPADAKTHIRDAARLISAALKDNTAELECQRRIAGLTEQPEPGAWSQRKVVEQTRAPLQLLANGVKGRKRDEARALIFDVLQHAPAEMVGSHQHPNLTIQNQLQPIKTAILWDLVDEHREARP